MTYRITKKMENLMLDILILKQIVSCNNISNRKKLEKSMNELINKLIVEFNTQNKKNKLLII